MTAPGNSFNLTEAALRTAQERFDAAALAVQNQFTKLEQAVLDNRSRGAAFLAAQRVAAELKNQAREFQDLTQNLAASVGLAAKKYTATSQAGVQAINAVTGGASYDRLVGKA